MTSSNCCIDCPGSCHDCTRKHLAFCIHPNTYTGIAAAAEEAHVSMPDFLVDSAWERAREHRDQKAKLQPP